MPSRREWLRQNPLDVAIVVFTPPFLPALLQGLRAARLLRLLSLVRLARVGIGFKRAFTVEGLRWAGLIGLLVVLGGGTAFATV